MSARTKEFSSGTWSTHELTCIWGERIVRRRAHGKIKCNCQEEEREGWPLIPGCNGLAVAAAAVVFRRVGKRIIRLQI